MSRYALSDHCNRLNIITNMSQCDGDKFTAFATDNMDDLHFALCHSSELQRHLSGNISYNYVNK